MPINININDIQQVFQKCKCTCHSSETTYSMMQESEILDRLTKFNINLSVITGIDTRFNLDF